MVCWSSNTMILWKTDGLINLTCYRESTTFHLQVQINKSNNNRRICTRRVYRWDTADKQQFHWWKMKVTSKTNHAKWTRITSAVMRRKNKSKHCRQCPQNILHLPSTTYMTKVEETSEDLFLNELSDKSLVERKWIPGTHFLSSCTARFINFCPTKAYMMGLRQQWVMAMVSVTVIDNFKFLSESQSSNRLASYCRNRKKLEMLYGVQNKKKTTTMEMISLTTRCFFALLILTRMGMILE